MPLDGFHHSLTCQKSTPVTVTCFAGTSTPDVATFNCIKIFSYSAADDDDNLVDDDDGDDGDDGGDDGDVMVMVMVMVMVIMVLMMLRLLFCSCKSLLTALLPGTQAAACLPMYRFPRCLRPHSQLSSPDARSHPGTGLDGTATVGRQQLKSFARRIVAASQLPHQQHDVASCQESCTQLYPPPPLGICCEMKAIGPLATLKHFCRGNIIYTLA